MPTRNVVITDRQQSFIDEVVATGEYQNASEVLREGLRMVEQSRESRRVKLELLRQAAQKGWDDLDAGRYVEGDVDDIRSVISAIGNKVNARLVADEAA